MCYLFDYFRYLGIVKSKKNSSLSKYKSTKVLLTLIILIAFLIEIPTYFEFEVEEINCKNETVFSRWPEDWIENEVYQHMYKSTLYPLFIRFLPLILTSIFTYKLVRFLMERRRIRKNLLSSGLNIEYRLNVVDIDHLTKVLTMVALVYVICLFPSAVHPVIGQFIDVTEANCDSAFGYFAVIADILGLINVSENFFIYYLNIPAFKKCIVEIIPSCRMRRNVPEVYIVQSTRL